MEQDKILSDEILKENLDEDEKIDLDDLPV